MKPLTPKQLRALHFYAGLERRPRGWWPHQFTVESLRKRGLLGFDPCSIVRGDGCLHLREPDDTYYDVAPLVRTGFRLHGHEYGTGDRGTALTLTGLHALASLRYAELQDGTS